MRSSSGCGEAATSSGVAGSPLGREGFGVIERRVTAPCGGEDECGAGERKANEPGMRRFIQATAGAGACAIMAAFPAGAAMAVPDFIHKYREHGLLFGGGLLGGVLLFLVWVSLQPSRAPEATPGTTPAAAQAGGPALQRDGVLGDIAGEFEPGARVVDVPPPPEDVPPPVEGELPPPEGEAPPPSDEDAIAAAMLSPEGGGTPRLQTWYVEVARGPGVSEILEIDAPGPEQALDVLRDFRGNPRVLRGPSPQPLP